MGANSKIEWTDHTWSPWWGCTKVSPACAHCYAASWALFTRGIKYAKGEPRVRIKDWKKPRRWNRDASLWMQCPKCAWRGMITGPMHGICPTPDCYTFESEMGTVRQRVFPSMMDWLDDEVPIEWLADLMVLIHATPNLDWLLLTKRPENWRPRLEAVREWCIKDPGESDFELHHFVHNWLDRLDVPPPANVWIGTTVENQQCAEHRIPALLSIPARVRFLSCEPLLGPVLLRSLRDKDDPLAWRDALTGYAQCDGMNEPALGERIHWVIAGGESGAGARPSHPDWFRDLRDQCVAAGVPFHFKQWGQWGPCSAVAPGQAIKLPMHVFDDGTHVVRVVNKFTRRELDGREWNEFPKEDGR